MTTGRFNVFSAISRIWRIAVVCIAWVVTRVLSLSLDLQRRQEVCRRLTAAAARGIALSYTVRIVYVLATLFCFYNAFAEHSWKAFQVGSALVLCFALAETLWNGVLYAAALVSRLDTELSQAKSAVERCLQSKASSVVPSA